MNCVNCAEVVETHFAFCEACGHALQKIVPVGEDADVNVCACSSYSADGYCEECGRRKALPESIALNLIGEHLASASHRGRHHQENQDAVGMLELDGGVALAVADGVSTADHAKAAAELAITVALKVLQEACAMPAKQRLQMAIRRAHSEICSLPHDDTTLAEPQATLVLALVEGQKVSYAWIGDSRLYVLDGATSTLLTTDDSWLNEQLSAGVPMATALKDGNAHCITQCLGMRDAEPEIHVAELNLQTNNLLMLCSDGLWNYFADQTHELPQIDMTKNGIPLSLSCTKLIDFANQAGGHDNISVVLYRHSGD